jgi:hypothetical protein
MKNLHIKINDTHNNTGGLFEWIILWVFETWQEACSASLFWSDEDRKMNLGEMNREINSFDS